MSEEDDAFDVYDHFKGTFKKPEKKKCPVIENFQDYMDVFGQYNNPRTIPVSGWDLPTGQDSNVPVECIHEPIDVGFAVPKMVCKKCDKDL